MTIDMSFTKESLPFPLLICLVILMLPLYMSAQEYEVVSFEVKQNDISARTNSRVDANGRKCAIVKVYADDKIATVRGAVVGEIESVGMEKQVYMAHDAKQMELVFENHYPLTVVFTDYDIPSLTGQMTYILKLQQKANIVQSTQRKTESNQAIKNEKKSEETATTPKKVYNSSETIEIRKKAEAEYFKDNYAKAFDLFMTIPYDADAQFYLGKMYDIGQGVVRDYTEAIRWYHKAIDQGHARAQNNMGVMYKSGLGVSQNYMEAIKWYRKAADQGLAIAQLNLGVSYEEGQGVSQDYTEAAKWYRKAADQGLAIAQLSLGVSYEEGQGVSQDYTEAAKWYRKAADQGNADAQCNLGVMYSHGKGVSQDYTEAVKWYRKAADQGNAQAQCNLGVMYYNGSGVEKDLNKAKQYWTEAAEKGNQDAIDNLKKIF